jgi:hypothetical protein
MGRPMGELPISQETLVYTGFMQTRIFFRLRGLSLDKNTFSQSGSFFSRGYNGFGEPFYPGTFMFQGFFSSRRSFYVFVFIEEGGFRGSSAYSGGTVICFV